MSRVITEVEGGVAVVTLNDPKRRNALDLAFCDEVTAAFDAIEADPTVAAVVVTGAPPAFCAGADLSHLGSSGTKEGLLAIYEGFLRVGRCPLPTIAAVNGPAVGAGMNLALVCDLRLAGRSARFDTRFLQLGIHPGGGHTWMFRNIVGLQATFAAVVFGEVLDGPEAERCGLVWRCVEDDALLDEARKLGGRAAAAPPELVKKFTGTIRTIGSATEQADAVYRELIPQAWSTEQPHFQAQLEKLRNRISGSGR
ncbi:MAG: enoyl-CoA hydratase [Acidimicrobiia bacterium]|nr:enoyl-CoA hydratase [Acidimicrobiia bacterium]